MEKLKIALLQLLPTESADDNLKKGINACRKARSMGADIALFPEMWSCGYDIPEDITVLKSKAVSADGDFVSTFKNLAKELKMAIAVTFLEKHDPFPRNTVSLFDMNGKLVYSYAKVHTCDFGDEARLSPGDDFYVNDLETEKRTVKVGSMICYDREFPESARILMLKGAELILVPNACPMELNRLSQLRGRAYENMLAIATCNYPAPKPDCNGHSTLFDGVVYLPELPSSRDTCVLEANENEGIFIAELDLGMLREYRENEVHGNAYRRPEKYSLLLSEEIKYPFVRDDRRN
ncbi:MAG: carbon-nitrogen hydrolase family protein [Oscillospiraceae bacterium]|nr:carbon-nitrogen hydrolase family protein [Oscillospiraceae bacterium]MDY6208660.1 carbon-nitrogen hydrolase family protein [Oscillospiraceae bacterium]